MCRFIDLTGQRFGKLTIEKRVENNKHNQAMWLCKCECGGTTITTTQKIKSGHTKSCGCLVIEARINRAEDHTGKRFSRLVVIGSSERVKGKIAWLCKCNCGKEKIVTSEGLKSGDVQSCGCLHLETVRTKAITHNLSKHPLASVWYDMKHRCTNKNNKSYEKYGGRGIEVCTSWSCKENGLSDFVKWGESNGYEKGLQLDREDNEGNYEPSNCRFITPRKNTLNRGINQNNTSGYNGVRLLGESWTADIGINYKTVYLGCHKTKKQAVDARNNYIMKNNLIKDGYKIQEYKEDING